jgi:hypothetical protein
MIVLTDFSGRTFVYDLFARCLPPVKWVMVSKYRALLASLK